jgi:Tfp pilus assembly protein PilO
MDFILPIILIASSFAVFFGYVDPNYKGSSNTTQINSDYSNAGVTYLKTEKAKYDDIVNSSSKIVSDKTKLVNKQLTISETDKARLEKLLPSNIDNIRLIIEIKDIAKAHGLSLNNVSVGDMTKTSSDTTIGQSSPSYGTLSMKFTVTASYNNFLNLLQDLESNLRLLDITDISFNSTDNGLYDFNVSLDTYWLK